MNNVTLKVEGMRCNGCAATIQALLERREGVRKVSAQFSPAEARVLYDPGTVSEDELVAVIEKAGYRITERRGTS